MNTYTVQKSVPPGFCDSAITEFIAKSSKLRNFRKSSQIFVIVADFPQILGLDTSRYVIATCTQSKKGCFSVWKIKNVIWGKSWPNGFVGLASRTCKRKVVGSNLRSGRDCWWGEYPPSIPRLRCPWARHRTPNCSPGAVTWLPTAPGVCSLRMG